MSGDTTVKRALAAAWQSDPGRVRDNNEDLALCDPARGVFAVIDGVGGNASGEVAAEIAHRVISARLDRPLGTPAEKVREAIVLANNKIFEEASAHPEHQGMTCVVTVAVVTDEHVTIGHVGDARAYKVDASGLRKLTRDHSPVGEREDAHELSEVEAMRHPRRNEVFRDVGSDMRDKDADGFVDVIVEPLNGTSAILLCTDGLSDMVPSTIIEHHVAEHAGRPHAVVSALVAAANEAGGRDNVTVVYVEVPGFAGATRNGMRSPARALPDHRPAESIPSAFAERRSGERRRGERRRVVVLGSSTPAAAGSAEVAARAGTRTARTLRVVQSIWASRLVWLFIGAVFGMGLMVAAAARLRSPTALPVRTLIVGTNTGTYTRIADAMKAARSGDVVQLEAGTYVEEVVVPDGVHLTSRPGAEATLARSPERTGSWTAVTASGATGGRIDGIRIESKPGEPVETGMRISGHGWTIERMTIAGPMRVGIEISDAKDVAIRWSRFQTTAGAAISLDEASEAAIEHNTFVHAAGLPGPALVLHEGQGTQVMDNVFAGYTDVAQGLAADERSIHALNVVVPVRTEERTQPPARRRK